MPEVPDDILALIIDELQFDIDVDDEIDKTTARAVCLTCRRLLPFGRRLLYRTLKTRGFSSPQPLLPKAMAPRLLFAHLLEHPHLGSLVEELHYTEIAYPGTEDEVLDITELDKACPRLHTLSLQYLNWSEGSGEHRSSYLSRHIRALSRPSCNLTPRLRQFYLTPLKPGADPKLNGAISVKLGNVLARCASLERVKFGSMTLASLPSASPPPRLAIMVVLAGNAHSFVRLAELAPELEKTFIEMAFKNNPPIPPTFAATSHPLRRLIYTAGSDQPFDRAYFQQFNTFLASFPRLTELRIAFRGRRAAGVETSVDLHRLPTSLRMLEVEGPLSQGHVQAGPSPEELTRWLLGGGGPSLKRLLEVVAVQPTFAQLQLLSVCRARGIFYQMRAGPNYSLAAMDRGQFGASRAR